MLLRSALAAVLAVGFAGSAAAAAGDYDKTENNKIYTLKLHVPASAMAIAPLKNDIFSRFKSESDDIKSSAAEEFKDDPVNSRPCELDHTWRVTFENSAVLSLSNEVYSDGGGAHPNGAFEAIVWDKIAQKEVPISALFAPGQSGAALKAISDNASKNWVKILVKRSADSGEPITASDAAGQVADGIAPDADHLKTYALTYAAGQAHANGIVLLYGAGEVWAHAIGDFRVPVSATVFAKYLAPQWKPVFGVK